MPPAAIDSLKRARSHRPEAIRQLSSARLAALIRPAGFHHVKAARLKAVADWWLDHGGYRTLGRLSTDTLRSGLLNVHGVGRETADVILLYVFERRVFVIDAYARRVFSRIGLIDGDEPYESLRGGIEEAFTGGTPGCNEYHALIVEHAKTHCRSKPLCSDCCLAAVCDYPA
ncbi:MAG: endonuclease [Gammaproteobacteria bacterium]|nr:endonuclease [Gammaproteobacteria bacterium]